MYNITIIDLPFPLALYKKLLNKTKIDLEDMKSLSPSVYQSLRFLLNYKDDDLESTLCYTFEIEREIYDERRRIPLKPGGSAMMVNQKNKQEFIDLYVDYVFNRACEKQFQAFANGFRRVINSKPLELFYPDELMSFVVDTRDALIHSPLTHSLPSLDRQYQLRLERVSEENGIQRRIPCQSSCDVGDITIARSLALLMLDRSF